jgi:hypothetical protein
MTGSCQTAARGGRRVSCREASGISLSRPYRPAFRATSAGARESLRERMRDQARALHRRGADAPCLGVPATASNLKHAGASHFPIECSMCTRVACGASAHRARLISLAVPDATENSGPCSESPSSREHGDTATEGNTQPSRSADQAASVYSSQNEPENPSRHERIELHA